MLPSARRMELIFSSLLLCETSHEMKPPTSTGVLMPIGRYAPSANGSGGIFIIHRSTAKNAPAMYSGHGASPVSIIGCTMAAMAFACGACSAPSPVKPYAWFSRNTTPTDTKPDKMHGA